MTCGQLERTVDAVFPVAQNNDLEPEEKSLTGAPTPQGSAGLKPHWGFFFEVAHKKRIW
jgi:hypothetical protein